MLFSPVFFFFLSEVELLGLRELLLVLLVFVVLVSFKLVFRPLRGLQTYFW